MVLHQIPLQRVAMHCIVQHLNQVQCYAALREGCERRIKLLLRNSLHASTTPPGHQEKKRACRKDAPGSVMTSPEQNGDLSLRSSAPSHLVVNFHLMCTVSPTNAPARRSHSGLTRSTGTLQDRSLPFVPSHTNLFHLLHVFEATPLRLNNNVEMCALEPS